MQTEHFLDVATVGFVVCMVASAILHTQAIRNPEVSGPRWWRTAIFVTGWGIVAISIRNAATHDFFVVAGSLLLEVGIVLAWRGNRDYLEQRSSAKAMLWPLLLVLAAHTLLLQFDDLPALRHLVFSVFALVFAIRSWRDIDAAPARLKSTELGSLKWLMLLEVISLVAINAALWLEQLTGVGLSEIEWLPWMLTFYVADVVTRLSVALTLIALRSNQQRDLTQRNLSYQKTSHQRLLENLGACVLVFSPNGRLREANRSANGFFCGDSKFQSAAQLEPVVVAYTLLDAEGGAIPMSEIATGQALNDRRSLVGVYACSLSESAPKTRWVALNAYQDPADDLDDPRGPIVVTFIDISQQKQALSDIATLETRLEQARKFEALGRLAGGVVHDFNNILAAILGNTSMAKNDLRTLTAIPGVTESLDEIIKAATRGRDVVRQIQSFATPQQKGFTAIGLQAVIVESIDILVAGGLDRDRVRFDMVSGAPPVRADATQLCRVLVNLGVNAKHAIQSTDGTLTFVLDHSQSPTFRAPMSQVGPNREMPMVSIRIRDTGTGMDASTLKRLFEPFFTTKPPGVGTGLGMSIVQDIVHSLKGSLEVQSEPGLGTEIAIFLPAADPPSFTSPGALPESV